MKKTENEFIAESNRKQDLVSQLSTSELVYLCVWSVKIWNIIKWAVETTGLIGTDGGILVVSAAGRLTHKSEKKNFLKLFKNY